MKIRVISVGITEDEYIRTGSAHFLKQIHILHPLEEIRVKGVKSSTTRTCQKALELEAQKMLKLIQPRDRVVLLDRKGRTFTSEAFSKFLEQCLSAPIRTLTFVIGSAEGVSNLIRERADEILSLSKMTLTHEFSRLLLLEQIYRAFTILRGKRYHR